MDSSSIVLYVPALISTWITFVYFLLRVCHYLLDALSHQTEGTVATAMSGSGKPEHSSITGEEGGTEVYEQKSGSYTEQYGRRTQRPPGSLPLPRRRKDICLPSRGDASEHKGESIIRENEKGLPGRRHRDSKNNNGKRSSDPCANSTGVFTKCGSRNNASDGQSSNDEGDGRKCDYEQPDEVYDDGFSRYQTSGTAYNSTKTKRQVIHVALQTDTCETIYVTKNTLTAYTIAIVQNAQALQYDHMHIALQTARNQASLEMPLWTEELMTAHFNLAVLSKDADINQSPDAQTPEATVLDADLSTSNADEETYVKIPSRNYAANCDSKKQHPTGAVAPTCRPEYGLVNGIPAGYETDDSWDNDSHTHEHNHTHNIVPLLALRPWNNHPHRGREQPYTQNNNVNVRTGHVPYQRPWDNQLYRRRTRSQQALHARAYRKIQCRYPVQ